MKGRGIYFLVVLVLGLTTNAGALGPVAVSPGGEGSMAVISQECPTFSWSEVEGVVSYQVKVFEMLEGQMLSYEAMEKLSGPVLSVEIMAPAFSWTPSAGECFGTGKKCVWYVGAVGSDREERWSEGRGFEVGVGISVGMRDALKETVNEYLTKEWVSTESYQEVRKEITQETLREVEKQGLLPTSRSTIPHLGTEGSYNTFYGLGAGDNTTTGYHNTFIGAFAGYHNTTGDYNIFLGYQSGYNNTTGNSNTFLGYDSGYSNTGYSNTFLGYFAGLWNTTGGWNTFVGGYAGLSNTTGGYNTFLGFQSGYHSTTGTDNTFLGYDSGYCNTTGYDNAFLGYASGLNNTTGSSNTFLGYSSGFRNTTGSSNTFLGSSAGLSNTTGNYNTFLGRDAGYSNTTGNLNTFIGGYAGRKNTEGNNNTFVGISAGLSNTTGSNNSYLGDMSGYNNTTGNSNTFLGYLSGYTSTGSGNVFLGYNAGYNEAGSNKLYIANSSTSTPLIYGEFDNQRLVVNGNLGIGTTAPTQKIDLGRGEITVNGADTTGSMPPGMFSWENGRIDFGFGGAGGGNLEAYSKAPTNYSSPSDDRRGQFRFIYGGGAALGKVLYVHYDGTTWRDRMWLTYDGHLYMAGGAYTNGSQWINASSREYKENIESLDSREALATLASLDPVKFNYKADASEKRVGFIAEDVPELVATKDRKGMSPMDVVAVLTKVVQEQQKTIHDLLTEVKELKRELRLRAVTASVDFSKEPD
jgi:hypothetical protein